MRRDGRTTGFRRTERGSVLLIAVVAMLALGVVAAALAVLADMETRIGLNDKAQVQAEALAEAGLERARDALRAAATAPDGFTEWLGTPLLVTGHSPGGGEYWARIDDDCEPAMPALLAQAGCPTPADSNRTAVITAWARAGVGRFRVRAVVAVDTPWQHVCAGARNDLTGICAEPARRSGGAAVAPADPADPNSPAVFEALPIPALGCSTIDPAVHQGLPGCPPGSRRVLTGGGASAGCGAGYSGYFDCALSTPCDADAGSCPEGPRKGCVRPGDPRLNSEPAKYAAPPCLDNGATGMVFNYPGAPVAAQNPRFGRIGTPQAGRTVYVLRNGDTGRVDLRGAQVFGTLVVEGNGAPLLPCSIPAVEAGQGAQLTAVNGAFGYPLALLLYDPIQPPPLASSASPYEPQKTCADLGGDATIEGRVYSAGRLRLGSVSIAGSLMAFGIETVAGSNVRLSYDWKLGDTPPGFPLGPGNRVVMLPKSFVVCASYRDETGGPTPCN